MVDKRDVSMCAPSPSRWTLPTVVGVFCTVRDVSASACSPIVSNADILVAACNPIVSNADILLAASASTVEFSE